MADGTIYYVRDGAALVAAEYQRQAVEEGFDPTPGGCPAHHRDGQLAWAAVCYAAPGLVRKESRHVTVTQFVDPWPWAMKHDERPREEDFNLKAQTKAERIRLLVKAGALCCAEIDRLMALDDGPKEAKASE